VKNRAKLLAYPYAVWMAIFIVVPLLLVFVISITEGNVRDLGSLKLSTKSYAKFFDPMYMSIIWRSFYLAFISTAICLVLGYPVAYIIAKEKVSRRNGLLMFFLVPIWMNFLLRTYAWMTLLSKNGIINKFLGIFGIEPLNLMPSTGAVVMGMVYNFLPFMVLPIYTVLTKIDKSVVEAAMDLGAGKVGVFLKVIFPLSIPGVFSGITMVYMPAVSTFVISKLLGGGKELLIGNLIEQQFTVQGDWHFGSALSIILMVIILISMLFMPGNDTEEGGASMW